MTIIDHFWLKIGRHHRMIASVCVGNVAAGVSPGAAAAATDAAAGPADIGIPSETSAGEAAATALAWLHLVRGGNVETLPTGLFTLPPGLFWSSVPAGKIYEDRSAPTVVVSERTESFSAAGQIIGIDPL